MLTICLRFALCALWLLAPAVQAADITGKLRVIDGDTVDVGRIRVRLYGIDAPERGQPCTTLSGQNWACGDWVTRQLQDLYGGQPVRCVAKDKDRYGRVVAKCYAGDADIGARLVQDGLAFAYRKYAMDYDLDEKAALVAKRGIHGFTMQSPARYRLTRIEGRDAQDPNCTIKGNISVKGKRIYHMPGQKFYDRTGIQPAKGERWFCSEAQARASGWRPARR
ncbi:thermonuclease family protein [Sulfitobacter sp. M368]|uniref:thermonuclease family protein n=1 Tax=Sulfitobacter sp. M368 TaxID=2867021 RepID=UPI0021A9073F|nr:thermonuclease family protein [Sulfitobacter sp. M368]UWR16499.1 thermonuclease family protein [Sulfitobacter sp. M368]